MKITLKTTIVFSASLALVLNLFQFASSYAQQKEAFTTGWEPVTPGTSASPTPIAKATAKTITTPTPTPATTDPVEKAAAALTRAGLNPLYASLYLAAEKATGTPWELLASVHRYETHQAGDTTRASYAGAQGPMQFMPATFRAYSLDGDGNGTKTISDVDDAVFSAGRYLAANGATKGQYSTALYHYNHSWSYVSTVRSLAVKLGM